MGNGINSESKKRLANALKSIIQDPVFIDEKEVETYLASIEVVFNKIKEDPEGFKVVLGESAEPYMQIMECLLDLYKSDEMNLLKKSNITQKVFFTLNKCDYDNPGLACSLEYISKAVELKPMDVPEKIKPKVIELYNALIQLCGTCPYKSSIYSDQPKEFR